MRRADMQSVFLLSSSSSRWLCRTLASFDASLVIPTATDIKLPQQAAFGTSALKAESTGTIATFGGTDPTLGQITLSAFMAGALRTGVLGTAPRRTDIPAIHRG